MPNRVDCGSVYFFLERMRSANSPFQKGLPVLSCQTGGSARSTFRLLAIPALFLFPLFLTGCASASAGISTSNIPLGNREYEILGTEETTVSWWSVDVGIIGMPLEQPPVDGAVQRLLQEKGGDALVNLRYSTDRSIFLFMTRHRFHLKADVVKLKSSPAPGRNPPRAGTR